MKAVGLSQADMGMVIDGVVSRRPAAPCAFYMAFRLFSMSAAEAVPVARLAVVLIAGTAWVLRKSVSEREEGRRDRCHPHRAARDHQGATEGALGEGARSAPYDDRVDGLR